MYALLHYYTRTCIITLLQTVHLLLHCYTLCYYTPTNCMCYYTPTNFAFVIAFLHTYMCSYTPAHCACVITLYIIIIRHTNISPVCVGSCKHVCSSLMRIYWSTMAVKYQFGVRTRGWLVGRSWADLTCGGTWACWVRHLQAGLHLTGTSRKEKQSWQPPPLMTMFQLLLNLFASHFYFYCSRKMNG